MLIDVREERLLVISDLHLGNPFSLAAGHLRGFLEWARSEEYSICVNGDGLEILQASFTALASHSLDLLHEFQSITDQGGRLYYVVGNHDITLEHLLGTWLGDHITPFLNVRSGDLRVRVEHGHLYDPFFVRSPTLYAMATTAAGPLLHVYPDVYRVWSWYQGMKASYRKRFPKEDSRGSTFHDAADMLLARGFDAVVFGHTHNPEVVPMGDGVYINSGNWMRGSTFVDISDGSIRLRRWEKGRALELTDATPLLAE